MRCRKGRYIHRAKLQKYLLSSAKLQINCYFCNDIYIICNGF
ncbi:hypothetical protein HMPREF0663_11573 [Hoylesella oralis ATCC 33269]|uniref:Uncharacterized protein n=1 Tax=Hoylesella oralis ATCC 33269 TaxID=873533 RepID=E7RQX2_9BACT|nr:hypothetical protein HMPREF0663_11573 [Hoylesella oralis ATCC 33269]